MTPAHNCMHFDSISKSDHFEILSKYKNTDNKDIIKESQNISIKNNSSMYLIKPPVGYYKINYSQVQKNPRVYDFQRSVPHFNRDRYFCN